MCTRATRSCCWRYLASDPGPSEKRHRAIGVRDHHRHNEQARIREKLDNTLELSYPRDKLQIIVASDCSDDATDQIVQSYASRGIRLARSRNARERRRPKNVRWVVASGEIILFLTSRRRSSRSPSAPWSKFRGSVCRLREQR